MFFEIKKQLSVLFLCICNGLVFANVNYDYNEAVEYAKSVECCLPNTEFKGLPTGTLVCTPVGPIAVDKLKDGDQIICLDQNTGNLVTSFIEKTCSQEINSVVEIIVNDTPVFLAPHQLVLTTGCNDHSVNDKWIQAKNLTENNYLVQLDQKNNGPLSIQQVKEYSNLNLLSYEVEVADHHNLCLVPLGIIVHNLDIESTTWGLNALMTFSYLHKDFAQMNIEFFRNSYTKMFGRMLLRNYKNEIFVSLTEEMPIHYQFLQDFHSCYEFSNRVWVKWGLNDLMCHLLFGARFTQVVINCWRSLTKREVEQRCPYHHDGVKVNEGVEYIEPPKGYGDMVRGGTGNLYFDTDERVWSYIHGTRNQPPCWEVLNKKTGAIIKRVTVDSTTYSPCKR